MDVAAWVDGIGGFAPRAALVAAGVSDARLGRLVLTGVLRRPRRGWYSTRDPRSPAFRALAVGGRLTGVSALAEQNAWIPNRRRVIHVAVPPSATRLRRDPDVRLHWTDNGRGGTASRVATTAALVRAVLDEDLETAVCCLDWALSTRTIDRIQFEAVLKTLPRSARSIRDWVDERSESPLESIARVRLRRRGWAVESQVPVGLTGRIDLVVEGAVALELDGRRFHEATFSADRRKDLAITIDGRHAIRVDAALLHNDWLHVESAVQAALASRRRKNSGVDTPLPRGRKSSRIGSGSNPELFL